MNQNEQRTKTGHIDQICSIKKIQYQEGPASGQQAYLVENGALSFAISATLGMDMSDLRCNGINLCHVTKPGWLANTGERDNFIPGGMFFTCGLKNVGPQTEEQPAHGKQRFLPAENVTHFVGYEDGVLKLRISGEVREAGLFSLNLLRKRTIETEFGSRKVVIRDRIENQGFSDEEIMMLYHFNVGFPLLDEGAEFLAPSLAQTPRDQASELARGKTDLFRMDAPRDCYPEQVFYHDLAADEDGNTFCALKNGKLGMALRLSFNKNELPVFTQWKSIASGDYVFGMEPGICHVEGLEEERAMGTLVTLPAGETRSHTIVLDVLSGEEELASLGTQRQE